MNRKEMNCRVFFDTEDWIKRTEKLRRAVRYSQEGSVVYPEEERIETPSFQEGMETKVSVTKERSFACALRIGKEQPGARIGVLNFASAKNPGGGVRSGSNAQEESLCRCSTLYPVLNSEKLLEGFYRYHRMQKSMLYTGSVIYSPDIVIFKTDTTVPERMEEADWQKADVITCAAPNLSQRIRMSSADDVTTMAVPTREELYVIHTARARRILSVAAMHKVDVFITGAFGCGAFCNDPVIVSEAWRDVLTEMNGILKEVIFAVYGRKNEDHNYQAFVKAFQA